MYTWCFPPHFLIPPPPPPPPSNNPFTYIHPSSPSLPFPSLPSDLNLPPPLLPVAFTIMLFIQTLLFCSEYSIVAGSKFVSYVFGLTVRTHSGGR